MRKKLLSILLVLCMFLSLVPMMNIAVSAEEPVAPIVGATPAVTFTDGHFKYTVLTSNSDKTGTVSVANNPNSPVSGDVVIPSSVIHEDVTYTVTRIDSDSTNRAFGAPKATPSTAITSVVIPDTVTYIGAMAFTFQSNLSSVVIGKSVTEISNNAFHGTALTEVYIPASVTAINENAFSSVKYTKATFENFDNITQLSFASFNGTKKATAADSGVTVDIVGFKNDKTFDEVKFRIGQLLKPVVSNYTGDNALWYKWETDDSTCNSYLTFYTSDTSVQYNGISQANILKGESYASLYYTGGATYIKCTVMEVIHGADGNVTFKTLAEKKVDFGGELVTSQDDALEQEFGEKVVLLLKKGEMKTVANLIAASGFVHLNCSRVSFTNVKIETGADNITLQGTTTSAKITGVNYGLAKISLTCKLSTTAACNYHGTNETQDASFYIYVIDEPDISTTTTTATIDDDYDYSKDNATTSYSIGNFPKTEKTEEGVLKTNVTTLTPGTTYDVLQTLYLTVGSDTYKGFYHHSATTKYGITNGTPKADAATNNGYVTVVETANPGETVTVYPNPNKGYACTKVLYKEGKDGEPVELKLVSVPGENEEFGYTFEMPQNNVTITAEFEEVSPIENAEYYASLTLNESIDINFEMNGLDNKFVSDNLKMYIDGESVDFVYDSEAGTVTTVLKSVAPKDIAKDVHVILTYKKDAQTTDTVKDFTYSIRKYSEAVFAATEAYGPSSELGKLCIAVLNYGAWADNYFNKKTDSDVNKDYEIDFTNASMSIPTVSSPAAGYAPALTITDAKASLALDSTFTLTYKIYTAKTLTKDKVIITNNLGELVVDKQIGFEAITGGYEISVKDIYASNLYRDYTLTIDDADTADFYINYGVNNYCYAQQESTEATDTLKNLCKAIYHYGQLARDYIPEA